MDSANRNILRLFIIRGCRLLLLLTTVVEMVMWGLLAGDPLVCIAVGGATDHDLFNDGCNDFVLLRYYIFGGSRARVVMVLL